MQVKAKFHVKVFFLMPINKVGSFEWGTISMMSSTLRYNLQTAFTLKAKGIHHPKVSI